VWFDFDHHFVAALLVAGLGIAPRLEDYEPSVQLYTTPHVFF